MSRRLPVLAALVAALALLLPAVSSGANAVDTPGAGGMSPGFRHDLATLAPSAPYNAFVRVQDGLDAASVIAANASNVHVLRNYPLISAAFVAGPIGSIADLAGVSSVEYVQDNAKLELHGDTDVWATRVAVTQENVAGGPYTVGSGGPVVNGSGVGIAIVDSGITAAHPDLKNRVARNFKYVCSTPGLINTEDETCYGNWQVENQIGDGTHRFGFVEVPPGTTTDTSSGHGTHVAGIAAGDGTASTGNYPAGTGPNRKGTFTGVAPGATLYGFSTGEGISVLFATEAFYYIYEHASEFTPAIKVVNSSWGLPGGTAYDADDIITVLTHDLVDQGVTMVFSASNDGGDGSDDLTAPTCKDPKPGVICVANYDDFTAAGGRNGSLDASSSRGKSGDTNTHPDISAPGTLIPSTCAPNLPLCDLGPLVPWAPFYNRMTGTSMATPHVTGAVALLKQADPSLTPAQIEDLIQDNAYEFTSGGAYVTDPQNTGGGGRTSFDKGAGLLDIKATLDAMGTTHGTASAASGLVVASGDTGDYPGPGAVDIESLAVTQQNGSSGQPGFKYDLTVRSGADVPPSLSYAVFQNANGATYRTNITATAAGVTPGGVAAAPLVNAAPQDLARVGNTISFFVPFSTFGNPAAGEPFFGVWAGSYVGVIQDAAPGGRSESTLARPQLGRPFARF